MLGQLITNAIQFKIETFEKSETQIIKFNNFKFKKNYFFNSQANFNLLKESFYKNEIYFFKWFHSKSNYESKYWWMSSIFMKNNLSNKYFDNLSYLIFLNDLINNNNIQNKIVIIDEIYLALDFYHLLRKSNLKFKTNKFKIFFFKISFFFKVNLNLFLHVLKFLFDFNITFLINKILNNKKKNFENLKLKIFHLCINQKDISSNNDFICDYFKNISNLNNKDYLFLKLPWLFENSLKNKIRNLKKFNESNVINQFDYIGFVFQFKIFFEIIKCFKIIPFSKNYENLNIQNLLFYYKFDNTNHLFNNYIFWSYDKILNEIISKNNSIQFYDPFHMGISEIIQKNIFKRNNIKFYGYYHSLHSEALLGYKFNNDEIYSKFFPDTVIMNNTQFFQNSEFQKYDKFISGPAIRQNYIYDDKDYNGNKFIYDILFVFPLNHDFTDEIFELINRNINFLSNFRLAFKFHPKISYDIKKYNIKKNLDYDVINDDINSSIIDSKIVINIATGSFIDCLIIGRVSLTYTPFFSLDWNFNYISSLYGKDFTINYFNFSKKIHDIFKSYNSEKNTYKDISFKFKKNLNLDISSFLN